MRSRADEGELQQDLAMSAIRAPHRGRVQDEAFAAGDNIQSALSRGRPGDSGYQAPAINLLRGGAVAEITTFPPEPFPTFGLPAG